jgi:nitroreductase
LQSAENFRLFGAPHVAVISAPACLGPYALVDVGGYLANLLLAAQSFGLSAIPQAAIAMHSDVVHEALGIPLDRHIVAGVSFGYGDHDHPVNRFRTTRADAGIAVTWTDR